MALRWLTEGEIEYLTPLFQSEGLKVPDPKISRVLAEVRDGNVIGMIGIQLFPLVGPLWIHPDHREPSLAISLASALKKELDASSLGGYMVVASHEFSEKFCQLAHLREVQDPVYVQEKVKPS